MKGFVFDLDNTLFDRYATLTAIITENFDTIRPYINPAYTAEDAAGHLCRTEALYLHHVPDWYGLYDILLRENFFHPSNTPAAKTAVDFLLSSYKKIAINFPFIFDLLAELKAAGYKLGIVTNGSHDLQQGKLDLLHFSDYFDVIVISGDFAEKMGDGQYDMQWYKPCPEIFRYAAELLGEKPEDLYYVGDNAKNDVLGSRSAGFMPIWVRSRSPWILPVEDLPAHVVKDISELRRFL